MSFQNEFSTIRLILESDAKTQGVDAFCLSLIKAERQMRRLFTHLVFQFPNFSDENISTLKSTLADNNQVYFVGVMDGFDIISPICLKELVGDRHKSLLARLEEAGKHRNKLFHGQLTNDKLSREELLSFVDDISCWCFLLAENSENKIGYNGFTRNSFRKHSDSDFHTKLKVNISSVDEYKCFITKYMDKNKSKKQK